MIKDTIKQKGMTFIEVVMAMSLLSLVFVGLNHGFNATTGTISKVSSSDSMNKVALNYINLIRQNPKMFQVHFKPLEKEQIDEVLKKDNMVLAWDKDGVYEKEACRSCTGLIGYLIQPANSTPGLFEVHLRIYGYRDKDYVSEDHIMIFGGH